jgi:sporulation integral membrane protein YtvI
MPIKTQNRLQFLVNLAYYAAIAVLVYLGLKYVLSWILPFILAFGIVSIVNPVISFVNRKLKINHKAASIVVMVLIYGLTGMLLFELVVQAYNVLRELFTELPGYYQSNIAPAISTAGANLDNWISRRPANIFARFDGIQGEILSAVQGFLVSFSQRGMSMLTGIAGNIPNFVIAFLFTIMLSFFIGMQYSEVTDFLKAQMPERVLSVVNDLRGIINDIVLRYLSAVFRLMLITFGELSVGLLVLKTGNAIPIALGIAVFDALPLFGTGAIMIPWALIEAIQGNYSYALGLAILYAIVTVVRNIIEPHIVGQKLGLNPIVSMVSIYLGYRLIGIFGMIIMPVITQIFLELHKRKDINFIRLKGKAKTEKETEKPPEA